MYTIYADIIDVLQMRLEGFFCPGRRRGGVIEVKDHPFLLSAESPARERASAQGTRKAREAGREAERSGGS